MIVKLTENKLKQMIAESVNNILNESSYNDSPILKWVYWCYNYTFPQYWIPEIWGDGVDGKHLMKKFHAIYERNNGCHAMEDFMIELDSSNQQKLIDYVMNNF